MKILQNSEKYLYLVWIKLVKFESNAITFTSIFRENKIFSRSIWPEHNQRVNPINEGPTLQPFLE